MLNHTQILIVGQGLAGSLLAAQLWQQKADFRVMDLPDAGAASQVAGGAFIPIVFRTLKKAPMAQEYLEALQAQFAYLDELLGQKFLHPIPSLKLFEHAELDKWRLAKQTGSGDYIGRLIERVSLPGVHPGFAGAIVEPSGYLDIQAFTFNMARWLKQRGLYIEEQLSYSAMEFTSEGVVVNNQWKAEKIVFCEGAAALQNPWFPRQGFSLNKGEILKVYAPELSEDYILRKDIFVLPLGNHIFRVGATYERNWQDSHPGPNGREELMHKLKEIIKVPFDVSAHKAGIRPAIKDRNPVLGQHPDKDNLLFFNGLGSKGVFYGPYWAARMADLLVGKDVHIPHAFHIGRYPDR